MQHHRKQRQQAAGRTARALQTFDPSLAALRVDLGLDKVLAYQLDPAKGTLTAHHPPLRGEAGPARATWTSGRWPICLRSQRADFDGHHVAHDAKAGSLTERQTVSTLPASFSGSNSGAEIVVHSSGKFVYSSNRGHNSIALFRIDPAQGTLTFVEAQDTGGRTPRNFAIDPTGRLLFAANQNSGTMMVFTIDETTGQLKASGAPVEVPRRCA